MKRWFGEVPWEVRVAGVSLVPSGQALDIADPGEDDLYHDGGPENERDSTDWGASTLLWLARCQLAEMKSLLSDEDAALLAQGDDSEADSDYDAHDAQVLREGLALLAALDQESLMVHHSFNVAGDITMTLGPEIPASPALGLRGSWSTEMQDTPVAVLGAASEATLAAGRRAAITARRRRR